jgi:hypothetical protein
LSRSRETRKKWGRVESNPCSINVIYFLPMFE